MAVCIAGMHRSGTSMIARLLAGCGLYLGPPNDYLPPGPDNPEGFFENVHFQVVNDAILKHLGGAWDCPPATPRGWELDPGLVSMRARAAEIIAGFGDHPCWGWKDPRNSLTFMFWKCLLPDLQFVICLRNPLEVIHSLAKRQGFSPSLTQSLWLRYYRELLAAVPPDHRVVTHYDSYFIDPCAEVQRVFAALGLPVMRETVGQACSATSWDLRHHRCTIQNLMEADVDPYLLKCYLELCDEAGLDLVPKVFAMRESHGNAADAEASACPRDMVRVGAYAAELERRLEGLTTSLTDQEEQLHKLAAEAASKDQALAAMHGQIAATNSQIVEKEEALAGLALRLKEKEQAAAELFRSCEQKDAAMAASAQRLAQSELELAGRVSQLAEATALSNALTARLADTTTELAMSHRMITELHAHIAASERTIAELHAQIAAIGNSRSWRLIHRVKRIRSKLLPFRKAG